MGDLGIAVGLNTIEEIIPLGGYVFATDKETRKQFEEQRPHDIEPVEGTICLDLHDMEAHNLLDTLTISQERYEELKGKA